MKGYKGYLIDLDGTMYLGKARIDGAKEFIEELKERQIPYQFVTNNSSKNPEDVARKLDEMGIPAVADDVVTSSIATARYIKRFIENPRCFLIGEEGLRNALNKEGINVVKSDANVVVTGIDRDITYEKLVTACLEVRKGAIFISTNPDKALPTERGMLPGNGALTAVVSVSTGVEPIFIGKPKETIMDTALERLGIAKDEAIMVGDNYNTDILAGIDSGIDTLMVFTGVSSKADVEAEIKQPTYVVDNLKEWF